MKGKELFNKGVERIKSLGYRCYQPQSDNGDMTFCKITDGVNIGYIQLSHWRDSFEIGTVSKYGSQYRIMNPNEENKYFQYEFGLEDLTKEVIELTFRKYPNWVTTDNKEVVKWKDWKEYTEKSLDSKIYKGFIEL